MGLMNDTIAYDKWAMVFFVGNLNFKQEEKLFRFLFYKGILKPSNCLLKRGDI